MHCVTDCKDDSNSIIDSSQIGSLLEAAGRVGVVSILEAFWRSTDNLIEKTSTALAAQDYDEAAKSSHALKGSAANVGACGLANSARRLELALQGGASSFESEMNDITEAYAQTKAAFESLLQKAA